MNLAPRPKKCRNPDCRQWFTPYNSTQKACGPKCALVVGRADKRRKMREKASQKREQVKTTKELLSEAQKEFNAYIRERDRDEPCISCGRWHQGQWHASHYRSVGGCSSLRFDEANVHKACSVCNAHLSGNIVEYRLALLDKIGEAELERLETAPKHQRWTREEALEIKQKYADLTRRMRRERGKGA